MWETLNKVAWHRLTHAYGWAQDAPSMLIDMVSADPAQREKGWNRFEGAVNHQGDFYDSTVAAVPFLIEAVSRAETPERSKILDYLRVLWLEAPDYGGDPLVPEPPGGVDIPTPQLPYEVGGSDVPVIAEMSDGDDVGAGDEQFDLRAYRRMDLCAWQTGRAILAGGPVFKDLCADLDRDVSTAAAAILLMWPESRATGKLTLVQAVTEATDPVEQARYALEFGVYAAADDRSTLDAWMSPNRPDVLRVSAALALASMANPSPIPEPAADVLLNSTTSESDVFSRLPRAGLFERGLWGLPSNAAELILRLATSQQKELRWRAVQGLDLNRTASAPLSDQLVVPLLLKRLSDPFNRIRDAAALALAQRGAPVLAPIPSAVPSLLEALHEHRSADWGDCLTGLDEGASVCGHAARLFAALSPRLSPEVRRQALTSVDLAIDRFSSLPNAMVSFGSMSRQVSVVLGEQSALIAAAKEPGLSELFGAIAFPRSQDLPMPLIVADRALADAHASWPEETKAFARDSLRTVSDRKATVGVARWLGTVGPAAEWAIADLDALAQTQRDSALRHQAVAAAKYIRRALHVASDLGEGATDSAVLAGHDIKALLSEVAVHGDGAGAVSKLTDLFDHSDPYVRASAAEAFAVLPPTAAAISRLEAALCDDQVAEIGISGEYQCKERLFHWRLERVSPRAAAIRALFAAGIVPAGDVMLDAMLAESSQARVECGEFALLNVFELDEWKRAVEAAGGLATALPKIRSARRRCQATRLQGSSSPFVCAATLGEIVRRLDGRLIS